MSAWIVPESACGGTGSAVPVTVELGGDDEVGEHDRGGGVDRHRHRHVAEVDAGEERLHVVERVDRDALAPDLAERARVIGVVAHQRGHVEGGGEPGLAVVEQVVKALVGLLAGAEAGELAHRPQPAPVHRAVDPAREGVLARCADGVLGTADPLGQVGGRVELLDGLAGERAEAARLFLAVRLRTPPLGRLGADRHAATNATRRRRPPTGAASPVRARAHPWRRRALASRQEMRSELSRIVGAEHVLEAPPGSPYNRDAAGRRGAEGRAEAVVLPGSAEEVAAVVRWCYAHDVPIVPRGGGTGMMGGAVAMTGGVVCSLERLRAVRELEPALWRILPEAGVSTRHVQRLARENGLFFGPDPGAAEQSQIGGNVATNAGGPHALKHGVTGAWVAGLEVVLAPGELLDVGGWLAKDVAGYDLRSLLIGSEGTLGVITAVRLRLLPAPEAALASVVFLQTRTAGCAAIETLLASGLRPSVLDFLDRDVLEIAAGAYPPARDGGGVPAQAGFALVVEFDGARTQAEDERRTMLEVLGEDAVAVRRARGPARRCGAGGTGSTRWWRRRAARR